MHPWPLYMPLLGVGVITRLYISPFFAAFKEPMNDLESRAEVIEL